MKKYLNWVNLYYKYIRWVVDERKNEGENVGSMVV